MNTDALVELIAKRVMEQLLALQSSQAISKPMPSVLVVGDCDDRVQLEQRLAGFQLTYSAEQPSADPAAFDHVLLTTLPNSLLSALAIGLERGDEGCVIVNSLLLGKTVHILEEGIAYRRFRETATPAFYQVFQDKETTLCSFGMKVVNLGQLSSVLAGAETFARTESAAVNEVVYQVGAAREKNVAGVQLVNNDIHMLEKRVIGEKDLRTCYEQGYRHIKLMEKAVVTPLAKDFIRMNKDLVLAV
ncbi:hypothetical protein [Endozoicomonas ascidiicola]|uniref:hypothetical protein n=1 Tax=Endozoicomonas ascidiicola TaxID=1698521 RepID=UPI0008361A63|nr:hypothetical protein [Endozoicomonas ascidiicola]